jgi:hypothetical protein
MDRVAGQFATHTNVSFSLSEGRGGGGIAQKTYLSSTVVYATRAFFERRDTCSVDCRIMIVWKRSGRKPEWSVGFARVLLVQTKRGGGEGRDRGGGG